MERHPAIPFLLACLVSLPMAPPPARAADVAGRCDVRFLGSSTLHDFSGTARCRPFGVLLGRDAGGRLVVSRAEVEVPAAGMDTGNASRDREMRGMFQADRYPVIRGTFRDIDADGVRRDARSPGGKASIDMALRIRDVERTVRVGIIDLKEGPDGVSFDAEIPVSLGEYGLKPPVKVLGLLRVADAVAVKIHVTLGPVPPAP